MKRMISIGMTLVLLLCFAGCGSEADQPQEVNIMQLMYLCKGSMKNEAELKTLVSNLPFQPAVHCTAVEAYPDGNPASVSCAMTQNGNQPDEPCMRANAYLMFALLDDVDRIVFTMDEEKTAFEYSRADADSFAGGDVRAQAETELKFNQFFANVTMLTMKSADAPDGAVSE